MVFATPPTELVDYSSSWTLASFEFPKTITMIGHYCLRDHKMEELVIPSHVKYVGGYFSRDASKLKRVFFEAGAATRNLGHGFSNCNVLEEIVFPETTTELNISVGMYSPGLKKVVIPAMNPPRVVGLDDPDVALHWGDPPDECRIYVPAEAVDTYKKAQSWHHYADRILPIP